MGESSLELVKGTLDVLVLKALSWGPMHGYGVSRWIHRTTRGELAVEDAALYQALHRMEGRGWLEADWGRSDKNRRAKFYRLTSKGRKQLAGQSRSFRRYVGALLAVLDARSAEGAGTAGGAVS